MSDPIGGSPTIEVIRGRLDEDWSTRILDFWSENGALTDDEAQERLPEVLSALVGDDGRILGLNSAYASTIPMIGGCEFWMYRSSLLPEAMDAWKRMVNAAWEILHDEFNPKRPLNPTDPRGYPDDPARSPVGLCVRLAPGEDVPDRRDAEWADPRLFFAGSLEDGTELRLSFFDWASATGDVQVNWLVQPLEDRYTIDLFAERDDITEEDVLAMWRRGAPNLSEATMVRRVTEVLHVAVDEDGSLAGVSTVYIQRNAQLGMDFWYYRTFVSEEHRMSHIATSFSSYADECLCRRAANGEDTRASGIIMEVENEVMKKYFCAGAWITPPSMFIGLNAAGAHVRVRYFPGAKVPSRQE